MSLRNRLESRPSPRRSEMPVSPAWTTLLSPALELGSDRAGALFVLETVGEPPLESMAPEAPEQALKLAEAAETLLRASGYCPSCGVVHTTACTQTSFFPGLAKKLRAVLETLGTPLPPSSKAGAGGERSRESAQSPLLLLAEAIRLHPRREYHARLVSILDLRIHLHGNDASLNDALSLILESWVKTHPEDVDGLLRIARFSRHRGATRRALEFAEQAEQLCPERREIKLLKLEMLLGSALRRMRQRRASLLQVDVEAMSQLASLDSLIRPLQMALRALAWELSPSGQSRSDTLAMVAVHTGDPVSSFLLVQDLVELGEHPGFRMTLKIDSNPATALHLMASGLARFESWRADLGLMGSGIGDVLRRVSKRLPPEPIPCAEPDWEVICRAASVHGPIDLMVRLTSDALILGPDVPSSSLLLWRARALERSGCAVRRVEECFGAAYTRALQEQNPEQIRVLRECLAEREQVSLRDDLDPSVDPLGVSEALFEQVVLREKTLARQKGVGRDAMSSGARRGRKPRALVSTDAGPGGVKVQEGVLESARDSTGLPH